MMNTKTVRHFAAPPPMNAISAPSLLQAAGTATTAWRAAATLPYLVFAVLVALELAAILLLNHDTFVYTLDDAYIHLALAERILDGTYGINLHESAAPASSILWPLLLAPFARLTLFSLLPLVINIAAAATTLRLLIREVQRAVALQPLRQPGFPVAVFAVGLILATNLVPLIFTGMEHSLQQLLAVTVVVGLIEEGRTGRAPAYLWAALLLLPLLRYDSMALVAPALVYLLWRGHIRPAVVVGGAICAALVGFSFFLMSHGLGFLPASVMSKSDVVRAGGAPLALALSLYANLVLSSQGNLLLVGLALVLGAAFQRSRSPAERGLATVFSVALLLQFVVGKFGAYYRYEVALWTATSLTLIHLYRAPVARIFASAGGQFVALLAATVAVSPGYLYALLTTPLAANNVYDQQYQMHRFVTRYYRQPVAVNDLGWVSFRNSSYVLDLAGLASPDALRARLHEHDSAWMARLCRDRGVHLVMMYDEWFPKQPAEWVSLGTLQLARMRITPAFKKVQFYATDPATAQAVRPLLVQFGKDLQDGSSFNFAAAEQVPAAMPEFDSQPARVSQGAAHPH
jgi:hypothetical protein